MSPRAKPDTNIQYCSRKGRFKPSCSRSSAAFWSVARSPRMRNAGSPGRIRTMPKMTMVTPNRTKAIRMRRLRM
jgi:hypothetical protein